MKLAAICFSKSGYVLMKSMREMLSDSRIDSDFQLVTTHHKCRSLRKQQKEDLQQEEDLQRKEEAEAGEIAYYEDSIENWAREQFACGHALLFIGATGIAVRAIASSVENKLTDSPVLVMDDLGKFVIPLLSGHMGGANELALQLSSLTGALPVITTSTDIHQTFAIDVWARKHHLTIRNKEAIKHVSAKLLQGGTCHIDREIWIGMQPPTEWNKDTTLWLQPKEYILGIGCKKGKKEEEIRAVIKESILTIPIPFDMQQIAAIASIDAKKEEEGILAISEKDRIPFFTFSAEELNQVPGRFHESEFVRQQMGVGSVCERAAVKLAMTELSEIHGSASVYEKDREQTLTADETTCLIMPKYAKNGVTVALAKRKINLEDFISALEKKLYSADS